MLTGTLISGFSSSEYADLIPENYMAQVRRGELTAVLVYSDFPEEKGKFYGLFVTGVHALWIEIVYIYLPEENRKPYKIMDFLQYLIRSSRRRYGGELHGAFCEIPLQEVYPELKTGLQMAGMEVWNEKGNVYEFSVAEIKQKDAMIKAAEKTEFRCVGEADRELLYTMERMMEDDERAIAASPIVEWQEYHQELSLICFEAGQPTGLILIYEQRDYLVLELVYTVSKQAMAKLIGGALGKMKGHYPEDQKILVPIVSKSAGDILRQMVPSGKRNDALQAMVWFEKPEMPKPLEGISPLENS